MELKLEENLIFATATPILEKNLIPMEATPIGNSMKMR